MTDPVGLPLGRFLASTEKKTRDKAIRNLSIFLSQDTHVISKLDMDKLWKGIFYCFWMSDKPLVQQALATELAELILTISTTPQSLAFLAGFWETTVREWNNVDYLRIDKYYMLIRRFVNATFRLLIREKWNKNSYNEYNRILTDEGGPLCPSDARVPSSLAYHIADIYIEELDKVLESSLLPTPAPLGTILQPFFSLAAQTPSSVTYKRLESAIFEPLFTALTYANEGIQYHALIANACYGEDGPVSSSDLKQNLSRRIFEVASGTTTRDSNRRKMYKFWKENCEVELDSETY